MFGFQPLPRTYEAAVRDVQSTKATVRVDALRDLVRHCDQARIDVVRLLVERLFDAEWFVRAKAAVALADVRAIEAAASLLEAVDDADPRVRQAAVSALGELGAESAAPRIQTALTDESAEVRFQALIAYPRLAKDEQAVLSALLQGTHDGDPLVGHIALRMLEEVCAPDTKAVDAQVIARAKSLLTHPNAAVRRSAAIFLARSGDRSGASLLVEAVLAPSVDSEDEAACIDLCGELGLRGAIPGLERRAFGGALGRLGLAKSAYQWNARVALAQMGHERAIETALRDLSSRSPVKRSLALAAVGAARLHVARPKLLELLARASGAEAQAIQSALSTLTQKGN